MKKFIPYILAVTMLVAGFFIGMFTAGQFTKTRIERFSSMRSPEGVRKHMYRDMNLTPEQEKQVEPIIKEHGERLRALTIDYRKSFTKEIDKFHEQLNPILSEEQKEIMRRRKQEFQSGYNKNRGDRRDGRRHPSERRNFRNAEDRPHDGPPHERRRMD